MGIGPLWSNERPSTLVVACSDGRFQPQLDAFLGDRLGIRAYDRIYLPGGPGVLATSSFEYDRADRHRWEYRFLMEAHEIERVILVFHGPSADGPEEAMCADYKRKMPGRPISELLARQESDARDLMLMVFGWPPELRVQIFRAETLPSREVQFVTLAER